MKISKLDVPFTQIANSVLNDPNISWKAKGIFAYIYSKPENWDFSTERMQNDADDGIDSLVSGIKELEKAGYLVRKKLKTGRVEYSASYKTTRKPEPEIPLQGKSLPGKTRYISNKDIHSNKDRTEVATPSESAKPKRQKTDTISFSVEVDKMLENKARHVQVIGVYMSYRSKALKEKITTYGQLSELISRHLRYASKLTNWTDEQLNKAFQEVEFKNKDIDWTLETVYKHLTK